MLSHGWKVSPCTEYLPHGAFHLSYGYLWVNMSGMQHTCKTCMRVALSGQRLDAYAGSEIPGVQSHFLMQKKEGSRKIER